MKKTVLTLLLLSFCLVLVISISFASVASNQNNFQLNNKSSSAFSQDWQIEKIDNAKIAKVTATGKTAKGEFLSTFRLQCPTAQSNVTNFEYIIQNSDKIAGFSFDDFEGPDAPNLKKKLVEINVKSSKQNINWLAVVTGYYGGDGNSDSFVFTPSTLNKPYKTKQIARLIAEGGAEVTIVAHDGKNFKKTIETTFPAIESSGEVAKYLKGCGK